MGHILLIDDDNIVIEPVCRFLKLLGYEVKFASNAQDGIDFFNRIFDIDLVITDINMPVMSGNSVAKHIKGSDRADIPILAITGACDDVNRELFDYVLEKPFKIKTLIDIIKTFEKTHANRGEPKTSLGISRRV